MTNSYVAKLLKAVARSKRGATAVEYGLIAALIAGVIATTVTTLGTSLDSKLSDLSGKL